MSKLNYYMQLPTQYTGRRGPAYSPTLGMASSEQAIEACAAENVTTDFGAGCASVDCDSCRITSVRPQRIETPDSPGKTAPTHLPGKQVPVGG
jgi:hypothetical protein